jgi:hypothetical protein
MYAKQKLYEFRWDGLEKHGLPLCSNSAYLWSSVTIYDEKMNKSRKDWFQEWRSKFPDVKVAEIPFAYRIAAHALKWRAERLTGVTNKRVILNGVARNQASTAGIMTLALPTAGDRTISRYTAAAAAPVAVQCFN